MQKAISLYLATLLGLGACGSVLGGTDLSALGLPAEEARADSLYIKPGHDFKRYTSVVLAPAKADSVQFVLHPWVPLSGRSWLLGPEQQALFQSRYRKFFSQALARSSSRTESMA